jgi:hypothetical protein
VECKPIENALLRFAESVRDHGFQSSGPFAAATQILLRPDAAGTIDRVSHVQILFADRPEP